MEDTKSKITSDDIFAMFLNVTEHSLMVDDWVPKGTQMVFFYFYEDSIHRLYTNERSEINYDKTRAAYRVFGK